MRLKPIIQEKAKERMLAGKADPAQKSAEGETRQEVAKLAGVSHDTIDKTEKILEKGTPEQIQRARRGRLQLLSFDSNIFRLDTWVW